MAHRGKISGKMIYTAEELLEKNPIKGSLLREIHRLEEQYEKQRLKNIINDGRQHAEKMTSKLEKINDVTIKTTKNKYIIKYKKHTICWLRNRNYGFGITDAIERRTFKVKNDDDFNTGLEMIKKMI